MKLFRLIPASLLIISFLFSSCAKEKDSSREEIENRLLDAFMLEHYKDDRSKWPAKAEMGYYYIPLKSTGSDRVPEDNSWIRYEVSSVTQNKMLAYTSSAAMAKQFSLFSYAVHYVPDYYFLESTNSYIPKGIADAMRNHMRLGDSIRLILPASLAVGFSYVPANNVSRPITIDIAVKDIVLKPQENEQAELGEYRRLSYPLAVALKGKTGQDTTGIFFQELEPATDTVVIKDGYTVKYLYTGKFLDGYMFDTNIADSAKANNIYSFNPTKYDKNGVSYKMGTTDSNALVKGFEEALKNMKVGSSAVVFFTSGWGYGEAGNSNAGMPAYTSLYFYITLLSVDKNE